MNKNGKTIEKFLALREVKRDAAANRVGKKKEDCTFKSLPASKKTRRQFYEDKYDQEGSCNDLW